MDTKVRLVWLVCLEKEVYQDQQDPKVEEGMREGQGLKGHLENKVREDYRELAVLLAHQASLETQVILDLLGPLEKLVLQV